MRRRHNEIRIHTVVPQIRIPRIAVASLHLIFAAQRVQRRPRHMNTARFAARLHVIGQRHIIRPHIELPLAQTQNAAQHPSRMDADTHVQVDIGGLDDGPIDSDGFQ